MRSTHGLAFALTLAFLCFSCGEDEATTSAAGPAKSTRSTASKSRGKKAAPKKPEVLPPNLPDGGLPEIDFQELDYGESERSRDPFRSYADSFVEEARSNVRSQREVVLSEYSLDDLKLTAIVMGANPSRAMLVDPTGKGHVVRRGQFIGRPETVVGDGQAAPSYEVNWRIDQIRPGDVVLVREDPNNPDVPTATKVISLHPEGQDELE